MSSNSNPNGFQKSARNTKDTQASKILFWILWLSFVLLGLIVGLLMLSFSAGESDKVEEVSIESFSFVDSTSDPKYNIVSPRAKKQTSSTDNPDGIMSIDLKKTNIYNFFGVISDATQKRVLVCKELSGSIDRYRKIDVPYRDILREISAQRAWSLTEGELSIVICGKN